jgi:hypothetical protein
MKYRIEWWKRKKKGYSSRQSIVMFTDEDVLHFIKNIQNDPDVSTVDVIPVMGE